jgi:CBS domain-containing protein
MAWPETTVAKKLVVEETQGRRDNMASDQLVSDLMTREVVTLDANEDLGVADDVMGLARIRHMPVIDEDGSVIGLVSQRDLFRGALARALGYGEFAQKKLLKILRVKEVMTNDVVTIPPQTPLVEAAKLMTDRKIGCLVAVEDGKLVGILTESDFVRLVL